MVVFVYVVVLVVVYGVIFVFEPVVMVVLLVEVLVFLLFGMIALVVGICVVVLMYHGCIRLGHLLGWVVEIQVSLEVKVRYGTVTLMFRMVV